MNILHNFCLLVGMEPHDVFVPFEPGHLFTRVNAGILLDFPDSEFQCPFSVQILEHFFVSYGIERVQMPERIYLTAKISLTPVWQSLSQKSTEKCSSK